MMHKKAGNELTKNNACQLFPADRHYSKLLFVCGVLLYLIAYCSVLISRNPCTVGTKIVAVNVCTG